MSEQKKPKIPEIITFPKSEGFQQGRKSLLRACGGNANASQLLGYLLGCARYGNEGPGSETRTVIKTQGQIVGEMPHPLSTRTLRDDARPCLVELGYLAYEDLKNSMQQTAFTLFIPQIQQGVTNPGSVSDYRSLPYFQALKQKRADRRKRQADRKRFRTEEGEGSVTFPNLNRAGSETSPHGWETSPSRIGNVTAWLGNVTDTQATIHAASKEDLDAILEGLKNLIRFSIRESNIGDANASPHTPVIHPLYPFLSFDTKDRPTMMTITFEDDERAEITNKGYAQVAREVLTDLEARGATITVRKKYCKRADTVDASPHTHTEVNHEIFVENGREHPDDTSSDSPALLGIHAMGSMGTQPVLETDTPPQVDDSYSQPPPASTLPSVSFLEANAALEVSSQGYTNGANDDNDTHPHFADSGNSDTLSENVAHETMDAEQYRPDWFARTADVLRAAATQAPAQEIAPVAQGATNATITIPTGDPHLSVGSYSGGPDPHLPLTFEDAPGSNTQNQQPGQTSTDLGDTRTAERGTGAGQPGNHGPVVPDVCARGTGAVDGVDTVVPTASVAVGQHHSAGNVPGQAAGETKPSGKGAGRGRGGAAAKGEVTRGNGRTPQPPPEPDPVFTEGGRAVYEAWCSLFRVPVPENKSIINAANDLYPTVDAFAPLLGMSYADVLRDMKGKLYADDRTGYYKGPKGRGVKLFDCSREREAWISAKEEQLLEEEKKKMRPASPAQNAVTQQIKQAMLAQRAKALPVAVN